MGLSCRLRPSNSPTLQAEIDESTGWPILYSVPREVVTKGRTVPIDNVTFDLKSNGSPDVIEVMFPKDRWTKRKDIFQPDSADAYFELQIGEDVEEDSEDVDVFSNTQKSFVWICFGESNPSALSWSRLSRTVVAGVVQERLTILCVSFPQRKVSARMRPREALV
jgi:hypothetical protein